MNQSTNSATSGAKAPYVSPRLRALVNRADAFGTIWGKPPHAAAALAAGLVRVCGVGYTLTDSGREVYQSMPRVTPEDIALLDKLFEGSTAAERAAYGRD